MYCRKLDKLHSGLGESLAVMFQSVVTFISLRILAAIYQWRLSLFFLGEFPFAILGGIFLKKVSVLY